LTTATGAPEPPNTPSWPIAIRNADFIDMSFPTGGGGLISTTGDLQRWLHALFGGKVLSPASFAKMSRVHLANYGYGLFVGEDNGFVRIGHGGSIHGFLSTMTYYPELDVVVVVLANITTGDAIGPMVERLVDIVRPKRPTDAGAPD
jgi:CubicO group peptidase (beta-lactamase class C family)